jgi:hypothetical protein
MTYSRFAVKADNVGYMTQTGGGPDTPDEFAHLFRPEAEPAHDQDPEPREQAPAPSDPFSDWEPLVAVPQATPQGGMRLDDPPLPPEAAREESAQPDDIPEIADDAPITPPADDAPITPPADDAPITPPADPKAGRLFRSRSAPERADAITAVGSMQARRLRTMARADEAAAAPVSQSAQADALAVGEVVGEVAAEPVAIWPTASSGEPAPALQVMAGAARAAAGAPAEPSASTRREERRERTDRQRQQRAGSGSLTGLGVYAVTIGVTLILAFGETLIFGGEPGVITGIGLLAVSIFAALAVRTYDGIHAIFAPSIAFFVASLTAGQVGITTTGLTGRAVVVFFLLGSNWIWILGSTAAALVIVALRRRVG